MSGELLSVMVCPPQNAGWNQAQKAGFWQELAYLHRPNYELAGDQHDQLCQVIADAGASVLCLPPDNSTSLDAVYAHDASFPTDYGVILMNPGKKSRVAEVQIHRNFYIGLGVPIFGSIEAPGTSEAGDFVWLDARTLLIGRGYRTNATGIEQIRALLAPKGIDVLSAPLPYASGPSTCLHLMSLMSMLDEKKILVDLPWLAVETVELLKSRGFRLIEIDYSERESLACNVLSLGKGRLIAIAENAKTNRRLQEAGFQLHTFSGSEICLNGSGGPTCLTRPLLRR
jgi:N-dimethylarginine dimethylaminohydrolase